MTLFAGRWLVTALAGSGQAWFLLVLLGPAAAPLLALAPSVRQWLELHPA